MDLLVRGKFVITDASLREEGILTDGAVYFYGGKFVEVWDYDVIKGK